MKDGWTWKGWEQGREEGRRCVNFVSAAAVRQGQSEARGTERAREERGVGISRIRSTRPNGLRTDGLDVSRDGKKGSGANTRRDTPTTTTRAATCARSALIAQPTGGFFRLRAKRASPPEPRTAPPTPLRLFTWDRENGRRRRRRRRDIAVFFRFTRAAKGSRVYRRRKHACGEDTQQPGVVAVMEVVI